MDYSATFFEMLKVLQRTYRKFPKFMIEIMAFLLKKLSHC